MLGNSSGALTIKNDGILRTTGACTILSEQADAVVVETGGTLEATLIDVAGYASVDSDKTVLGFLREQSDFGTGVGVEPPPDYATPPVDALTEQTYPEWSSVRLKPGHYPDGLIANHGEYRLRDGLYRFGGPGIVLRGTASLTSTNTLIYLDEDSDFMVDGSTVHLGGIVEDGTNTDSLEDWIGVALMGAPGGGGQQLTVKSTSYLTTTDTVFLPDGAIVVDGGSLTPGTLVCEDLAVSNQGTVLVGDQAPHPHEYLLVK